MSVLDTNPLNASGGVREGGGSQILFQHFVGIFEFLGALFMYKCRVKFWFYPSQRIKNRTVF